MAAAPADKLAQPVVSYMDQMRGIQDNSLLISLAHLTGVDLFRRVGELSKADWTQFTRSDVLDGLQSLAERDNINTWPTGLTLNPALFKSMR